MNKIAFLTSLNRPSARLAPHFGMAKWVMILDMNMNAISFIRNAELTGRSVIAILLRERCKDVLFRHIGPGALKQLKAAHIGGWQAKDARPARELAEELEHGQLRLVRHSTELCARQRRRLSNVRTRNEKSSGDVTQKRITRP